MLFLNRQQKGYGWYAKVVSKDIGGNETTGYINFSFKRGFEPNNLSDKGSYDGELYFIDKQGNKRKVFPIADEYRGVVNINFKLLEVEGKDTLPSSIETKKEDEPVSNIKIEDISLPFY